MANNNQINWGGIGKSLSVLGGFDPETQYRKRRLLADEKQTEAENQLLAAKLLTEGMRPEEIRAAIARQNAAAGLDLSKTQGQDFTNRAREDLGRNPNNRHPLHIALAELNPLQVTGSELDRQILGNREIIANQGIGDKASGPNYDTLARIAASGGNPSLSANVFHDDPDKKWHEVNGSLVNPTYSGAVPSPLTNGPLSFTDQQRASVNVPSNVFSGGLAGQMYPGVQPGGINMANGSPLTPPSAAPQAASLPQQGVPQQGGGARSLAGIISPPGATTGVKSADFENYDKYFKSALEQFNQVNPDKKSEYSQVLLPQQANSIAGLAHDLMANASQNGIQHPQQALEMAYEIATGTKMPGSAENVVTTEKDWWPDSTSVQGMQMLGYDQKRVDAARQKMRTGSLKSYGVDPELINKAIGQTATPGTTGMLPSGAQAPGSIASQVSQPAQAPLSQIGLNVPEAGPEQPSQRSGTVNAEGDTVVGNYVFKDWPKLKERYISGEVDPSRPVAMIHKETKQQVFAYWNPNSQTFQDQPAQTEINSDLDQAITHLTGKDDLDMLGGGSGMGKPISNLLNPYSYQNSVNTALDEAVRLGLVDKADYDMAVEADSKYDAAGGTAYGLAGVAGRVQAGEAQNAAVYNKANLLQSVLPRLQQYRQTQGAADPRIKQYAKGEFNETGYPSEARNLAKAMGLDEAAYGVPSDPWTGLAAAIPFTSSAYQSDQDKTKAGLSRFFTDLMSKNAKTSNPQMRVPGVKF